LFPPKKEANSSLPIRLEPFLLGVTASPSCPHSPPLDRVVIGGGRSSWQSRLPPPRPFRFFSAFSGGSQQKRESTYEDGSSKEWRGCDKSPRRGVETRGPNKEKTYAASTPVEDRGQLEACQERVNRARKMQSEGNRCHRTDILWRRKKSGMTKKVLVCPLPGGPTARTRPSGLFIPAGPASSSLPSFFQRPSSSRKAPKAGPGRKGSPERLRR